MSKTASTVQEVYKKIKKAGSEKVKGNLILTKPEIKLINDDREQQEAQNEYVMQLLNFRRKGIDCSENRLKWVLGQYPKTEKMQSPITMVLFECMVLLEVLRLAVKACVEQSGADQLSIEKSGLGMPAFHKILKPNMKLLKLSFDTELKWATKLSLWISERIEPQPVFTPRKSSCFRKSTRKGRRQTNQLLSRSTDFGSHKESDSVDEYHRIIDSHSVSTDLFAKIRPSRLDDKLHMLLNQLHTYHNQVAELQEQAQLKEREWTFTTLSAKSREHSADLNNNFSEERTRRENMDPQILFNNDSRYIISDDVPDLCEISTENVRRMLEGQSIDDYNGPAAKRRITSPNSQDLLCLIVAKMLNPDGQWKKLFTKLMYAHKCSAVEILEEITSIENKYPSDETRAFSSLRSWKQAIGGKLNTMTLHQSLEEIKRPDIVKEVVKYENRLTKESNIPDSNVCSLCKTLWF